MKWAFSILIALNILVFGYFLLQNRSTQPKELPQTTISKTASEPTTTVSEPAPVLASSESETVSEITIASSQPQNDHAIIASAEILKKPVTEDKKICFTPLDIDEKTYSSLKPSLNKFPHKVKRTENKIPRSEPAQIQEVTLYWVHIPAGSNSQELLTELKEKGFETNLMGREISIGLFRNPSGAAKVKQQAFNAGFTQVTVSEKNIKPKASNENKPEEIEVKYLITFDPISTTPSIEKELRKIRNLKTIACPKH